MYFDDNIICETIFKLIDNNIPAAMWCLDYVYFNKYRKTMNIKYKIFDSGYSIASDIQKLFLEKLGLEKSKSKIIFKSINEFMSIEIEELEYKQITIEEMYVLLKIKNLL